jgi:EmrB/QacA subfamily drug resistance transporter
MRIPCDAVSQLTGAEVPCREAAKPWILTATILASSMAFIDSTAINIALPSLQASFHATLVDVQWVVESYGLFLGALILVGGSLGDLFGRRLIFMTGVSVFTVASVVCGIAPSIPVLIVARSIQGVGAALLVPGSLAIISVSFDEKSRGQAIGTWSGFTAITMAVGPVLGGWLVEHASWRWVFFINPPLAAAVIAISVWRIPETKSTVARRVDWLGALLATLGLGGVVFGFIESTEMGWRNPLVFGSLIAGFGCLIGFAALEVHTTFPMIPLVLFKNPSFGGANLLTLFLYAAIGIFFFLFPLNLIQIQEYSSTSAGAAILPFILLMFLLSRWSGGLVARYGARSPLIVGPLIAALGFGLFAVPTIARGYWMMFFPAVIILGLGMTVTVAPLTTVVMNSVDQERVGTASGINNAIARVAGILAIAILGIVMVYAFRVRLDRTLDHLPLPPWVLQELRTHESRLAGLQAPANLDPDTKAVINNSIRQAFVFGFRIVMLICAGLSLASAAIAWLILPKASNPSSMTPRLPNSGKPMRPFSSGSETQNNLRDCQAPELAGRRSVVWNGSSCPSGSYKKRAGRSWPAPGRG